MKMNDGSWHPLYTTIKFYFSIFLILCIYMKMAIQNEVGYNLDLKTLFKSPQTPKQRI